MKIQHILFFCFAAVLAACAGDEAFVAGPEVAADCQHVHFDAANATLKMLSPDAAERSVELIVVRDDAAAALTVPVEVISASEGLTVTPEVSFAAGETTACVTVTAPREVSEGTSFGYELRLGGQHVNPYVSGATIFSGSISFPKSYDYRMWYSDASGNSCASELGYYRQAGYDLGDGRLLFPDLFHSGTDVWLLFDAAADYSASATVTTSPSLVEVDEEYPECTMAWAYDAPTDTYTTFRPYGEGSVLTASEVCFYYGGDGWSGYNPATGSGWIGLEEVRFNVKPSALYWGAFQFRPLTAETAGDYDFSEPDFGIAPPLAADGTVLTMKARLVQNNLDFNAFEDITATVCDEGTALQFDHFMNTDCSFRLTHNISGTYTITSNVGYQKGVEYHFRDAETDAWYLFYPSGLDDYDLGMVVSLNDGFNEWNPAARRIRITLTETFSSPDFHETKDDYLELTW